MRQNLRMEALIAILVICLGVPAAGIPAFPSEFYGDVSIGGEPAPTGTVIAAVINGEERGRVTTTVAGVYGGPDTFDRRLVVQGAQDEAGAEISFEINGVRTDETAAFSPGEVIALDLSASALPPTAAPTTAAAPARTTSQQEPAATAVPEETGTAISPVPTSPVAAPLTGGTDWPETTAPVTTAASSATIAAPAGADTSLSPLWGVILVLSAVIVLLAVMLVRKKP